MGFFATSSKGFGRSSALAEQRGPIPAKQAANPIADQTGKIEAVGTVTTFSLAA